MNDALVKVKASLTSSEKLPAKLAEFDKFIEADQAEVMSLKEDVTPAASKKVKANNVIK